MVLYAKDIVEKDYISLPQETTALEAAKMMARQGHGFVIVTSHTNTPIGIVTEWDYIEKIDSQGRNPGQVRLQDIMTRELVSIEGKRGLEEVAQVMASKGIRRLLVVEDGKIIGVVTARMMIAKLNEYVTRVSAQIARLQAPPF